MANKDSGDRNYGAFGITMVLAVLLLLLAAFFWPKTGSVWDDDATANVAGTSFYKNMECSCIGFTALRNDCRSCTQHVDCYGIPVSCSFTCRQKVKETWQDVSCGTSGSNPYPADRESCEAAGGHWGPIGLSPAEVCTMFTTDAGKECSDSSECQSACVADLSAEEYQTLVKNHRPIYTTGRCAASTLSVGCFAYVKNGVVNDILCVD
jgi:hypothetical protein